MAKKQTKNKAPAKETRGRKTLFHKDMVEKAYDLAKTGAWDYQIWPALGIGKDSFYRFKKDVQEFSDALKRGRDDSTVKIENALQQRAEGHYIEEVTTVEVFNDKNESRVESRKTVKKFIQSDTAAIFLLKKRKPEIYGDDATSDKEEKEIIITRNIRRRDDS